LAAYNPEINWETREVKITRCLPLYGKKVEITKKADKGKKSTQRNKLRRVDKRDKDD